MVNHWEEALYKNKGESLEGNYQYAPRRVDLMTDVMNAVKSIGFAKFSPKSKMLELGCNVALNLRVFHSIYDCDVTGFDINQEAVDKCNAHFGSKGTFAVADLNKENVLKQFKDNEFKLGFVSGFLMHLPPSENKTRLINEFIRVCKYVVIYEYYDTSNPKSIFTKNEWSLSSEDYSKYADNLKMKKIRKNYYLFYSDPRKPKKEKVDTK